MNTERQIEKEYVPVQMDEYQKDAEIKFRHKFEEIAHQLKSRHYPLNERYRALALTSLEQAQMWTTKAVCHNKIS